jgi:hypothetical protein
MCRGTVGSFSIAPAPVPALSPNLEPTEWFQIPNGKVTSPGDW